MKQNPRIVYQKGENASYAVTLGKSMGLSLVNIGGPDIVNGNRKLILAFIFQLIRKYVVKEDLFVYMSFQERSLPLHIYTEV